MNLFIQGFTHVVDCQSRDTCPSECLHLNTRLIDDLYANLYTDFMPLFVRKKINLCMGDIEGVAHGDKG